MSCEDQVQLMPVFRSWMSPGYFVVWFVLKECVLHTQVVIAEQFEQSLTVAVHPTCAMVSEAYWPGFPISSNSSVEVP